MKENAPAFGILPIERVALKIGLTVNPDEPLDTNFIYHDYRYGVPYNVKNFNPVWFNMTGAGKKYPLCGAMWDDERASIDWA